MSDGIKRRDFLKVLGASGAGAGLVGCSTEDVERLLPYVVPPEEITPGVATWYASVCGECAAGCGIWVRTREGRAVKIEGNPAHPVAHGGLCSRGHASLQGLYNPDRFAGPMVRDGAGHRQISWEEAEGMLAAQLQSTGGDVLLLHGRAGPTLRDVMDSFVTAAGGTRVEFDGLADEPLREAARIALGRNVIPVFDFESARFVVSFGADFLDTWLSPAGNGRGFARMSGVDDHGSKGEFVFVGPRLSLTGLNADEWVPITPGSEGLVALAMANVIAADGAGAGPYADVLDAHDPATVAGATGVSAETIEELANRFVAGAPSLAVGPGVAGQHRGATAANLAVLVLNAVAGNVGRTLHVQGGGQSSPSGSYARVEAAVAAMSSGSVGIAMVHGVNPAYSLPTASGFAEAFGSVGFKVSFASAMDETAALADLILPDAHTLEAWGDSNPRPGVFAIQQPVMQPVPHFDSKATGDVLLSASAAAGRDLGVATMQDHVRARWGQLHEASVAVQPFDDWWRAALRAGVVEVPLATTMEAVTLRSPDAALTFDAPALDGDGEFTLLVYPSPRFGDGEHSNRPWLLELPDPVSKIAWHSWLEMHPDAAADLGLRDGDIVTVSSPHGSLEVPLWTYPGVRADTVALAMGGGHDDYGRYATGNGVNAMALLPAEAEQLSGGLVRLATRVSVTPTGNHRRLATIAGSDSQSNRPIAPAVALADLGHAEEAEAEEGGHGQHMEIQEGGGFVPVPTEGRPQDYPLAGQDYGGYAEEHPRWAMAIDLDKCTGCSACVVACQSENNVPWVGEEQVLMGRDMGWMRIERYYDHVDATHASHLDVRFLPMLCQHCNNAPCEPVCPVFAAYHTPDGLNGQIYNRCVGTRYCANNCPYKVRVFNWYRYTDQIPEPMNWQFNPDVTVRDNGVMEKCTFCVQRIRESQNRAVLEGREVRDGEVVPACQQSCPAEAIVFGNIKDESSRVARVSENERTYRVLDELINTQPAVNYLKKVTFHEVSDGGHG
jgi:molybdopterin-containing oxidoreductase family iron-sulfur binding subunit